MATTITEASTEKVSAPESASVEATDETLDASETSEAGSNEESKEAQSEESSEDQPKKKLSGEEKRIRKLVKQRSEAQRETEYWKAEALKRQAEEKKSEETKSPTQSLDGKPKPEEFESHAEFVEALTDWKVDQRKSLDEKKAKETQVKTEFQKSVDSFQTKVKEFKKSQNDFEDVISDVDDIPMSVGVQETLLSSDVGPQLMYELAKDRENYERINALSPLAAARELGRIEARINAQQESSKEEPKKQSSAPAPLKPVGKHGSGGVKKSITDPDLSFTDYVKLRRSK